MTALAERLRTHLSWSANQYPEAFKRTVREAADTLDRCATALEPFADVDGEGDEDFPDDTRVVIKFGRTTHFAVKLGDFRRARHALTEGETQ